MRKIYVSPSLLSADFKCLEKDILEIYSKIKIKKIRELLLNTDYSLTNIAEIMKYNDTSALIKFFKKKKLPYPILSYPILSSIITEFEANKIRIYKT